MNSNELMIHVRELNKVEAVEHELKKQLALKRIRELRARMKENEHNEHNEPCKKE